MNWLALIFALEIGWMPQGTFLMYERLPDSHYIYEETNLDHTFFTDLEARILLFDLLYMGGGLKTIMLKTIEGWSFDPQAIDFKFITGIKLGPMDIFFRHHCLHPIMTYMFQYEPDLKWEGAYSEVGIRFEGRIN